MSQFWIIHIWIGVAAFSLGGVLSFIWLRRYMQSRFAYIEAEARAKAAAIEHEAATLLDTTRLQKQQSELELNAKQKELLRKEKELQKQYAKLHDARQSLEQYKKKLDTIEKEQKRQIDKALQIAEQNALLTQEEAKAYILEQVKQRSKKEAAAIIKQYVSQAKIEAKQKANYLLAQATSRYAGEFATERLSDTVMLPSDEHKGRIIGKEGRNIRTLEQILGVDIIIDETPSCITVSSFSTYRRAIAIEVLEKLIEDGRIQPARIEEVYEKVMADFDEKMKTEGEKVALELGVFDLDPYLHQLIGKLKYRTSFGQNALAHSIEVAKMAGVIAAELNGDEALAKRAGLLHDIGKALDQEHGGSHVTIGADLCHQYAEHPTVINAIYAHHEHEEPTSIESAAVCAADALSAARPGARRSATQHYIKRLQEIESIAMGKEGVRQAFAMHAGRELRIIVDAEKIDDADMVWLCEDIKNEIETKVQFPGDIRIQVIREQRVVAIATNYEATQVHPQAYDNHKGV